MLRVISHSFSSCEVALGEHFIVRALLGYASLSSAHAARDLKNVEVNKRCFPFFPLVGVPPLPNDKCSFIIP